MFTNFYDRVVVPNELGDQLVANKEVRTDETFQQLARGEFKSAGFHIINIPRGKVYAASSHLHSGNAGRYLFSEQRDAEGKHYLYLEEILPTHKYDESTTVRQGVIEHDYVEELVDVFHVPTEELSTDTSQNADYVSPVYHRSFGRYILRSEEQQKAIVEKRPFLISGPPGAGKTSVGTAVVENLHEKLVNDPSRTDADEIIFLVPASKLLAGMVQAELDAIVESKGTGDPVVAIRCVTYKQFIIENSDGVVTDEDLVYFESFATWAKSSQTLASAGFKLGDAKDREQRMRRKIYNEFKSIAFIVARYGVDAGLERYLAKPSHASLFPIDQQDQRKATYKSYVLYQEHLSSGKDKKYDLNFYQLPQRGVKQRAHLIADEVQLLAPTQIANIVEVHGQDLIGLCMDDMQNPYPGVVPRKVIHEVFYSEKAKALQINEAELQETWRSPQPVVDMLNGIVELQRVFGGGDIDGKHSYSNLVAASALNRGVNARQESQDETSGLQFVLNKSGLTELRETIKNNPEKYRLVVNDEASRSRARDLFGPGAQIFLAVDLGGTEFENMVLFEPFSAEEFKPIGQFCGHHLRDVDAKTNAHGLKNKETENANLAMGLRRAFIGASRTTEKLFVVCSDQRHEHQILHWLYPAANLQNIEHSDLRFAEVDSQKLVMLRRTMDIVCQYLVDADSDPERKLSLFSQGVGLLKHRDIAINDFSAYALSEGYPTPQESVLEQFRDYYDNPPQNKATQKKKKKKKQSKVAQGSSSAEVETETATQPSAVHQIEGADKLSKILQKNKFKNSPKLSEMVEFIKRSCPSLDKQEFAKEFKSYFTDGLVNQFLEMLLMYVKKIDLPEDSIFTFFLIRDVAPSVLWSYLEEKSETSLSLYKRMAVVKFMNVSFAFAVIEKTHSAGDPRLCQLILMDVQEFLKTLRVKIPSDAMAGILSEVPERVRQALDVDDWLVNEQPSSTAMIQQQVRSENVDAGQLLLNCLTNMLGHDKSPTAAQLSLQTLDVFWEKNLFQGANRLSLFYFFYLAEVRRVCYQLPFPRVVLGVVMRYFQELNNLSSEHLIAILSRRDDRGNSILSYVFSFGFHRFSNGKKFPKQLVESFSALLAKLGDSRDEIIFHAGDNPSDREAYQRSPHMLWRVLGAFSSQQESSARGYGKGAFCRLICDTTDNQPPVVSSVARSSFPIGEYNPGDEILELRLEYMFYEYPYLVTDIKSPKLTAFVTTVYDALFKDIELSDRQIENACQIEPTDFVAAPGEESDVMKLCQHFSKFGPQTEVITKIVVKKILEALPHDKSGKEILLNEMKGKGLLAHVCALKGHGIASGGGFAMMNSKDTVIAVLASDLMRFIGESFTAEESKLILFDQMETVRPAVGRTM